MAFLFFILLIQLPVLADDWGAKITNDSAPFQLKVGFRLQGLIQTGEGQSDFSLRRSRLNLQANFKDKSFLYIDVRSDRINSNTEDQGNLEVGDAYYHLPIHDDHYLRFFRAKVDISRSQTSSSSKLVFLNRSDISNYAADFISHNRRAPNIQLNGHFHHKLSYQLVISDSIADSGFTDSQGNSSAQIQKKNFAYGGKIRLSPIEGWEDKEIQESYIGKGKHFSIGVGYFLTPSLEYLALGNRFKINRSLLNYEASFHYKNLNLIAEYFYMQGQVEDFTSNNNGSSKGHYLLAEYFLR